MRNLIYLALLTFPLMSSSYETADADGISFTTKHGSRVSKARVLKLEQAKNGNAYVFVDKAAKISNTPECAYNTRAWNRWLIYGGDHGAQMQIAMLQSAAATGRLVRIDGTARCDKDASTETASSIILEYGNVIHNSGTYTKNPPSAQ